MSRRFSWLKLAYRGCLGQYDPWPSKELIESNEVMRMGKHERAILETLESSHGGDMQWTWHEGQVLGKLAGADAIRDFKEGRMRHIKLSDTVTVVSPYHNATEAAAFCRMSRSSFMRIGGERMAHSRKGQLRTWHEDVLIEWMKLPQKPVIRREVPGNDEKMISIDPVSGRVY